MDFLFINTQELSALMELPLIQRVTYLMGIRPYMDRQTGVVGIKRRISYQSLREALYVAPIAGVKTGSPSQQQVKRAIKSLEKSGLISIQSTAKHLILKCILAESDKTVQKQADPRPTPQADMIQSSNKPEKSTNYADTHSQPDRGEMAQADPPHNSVNNYVCLYARFEKFCLLYPQKSSKQKSWEEFQKLNPSEEFFAEIMNALQQQIDAMHLLQSHGQWTPKWKYPANWLAQHCWEDEINPNLTQEISHANHQRSHSNQQSVDPFWDSCKDGIDDTPETNVIDFNQHRKT